MKNSKQIQIVQNELSEALKKQLDGALLFQASLCGRGYVYIGLSAIFFIIGLSFRPSLWTSVAMAAVFFYQRMRLKELCELVSIEREITQVTAGKGDEIQFQYTIENLSKVGCMPFSFRDLTPYFRFAHPVVFIEEELGAGKKLRVRRKAICEGSVGRHSLGPVLVTMQDELGILQFQFGFVSNAFIDVHHGPTINKEMRVRDSKDSPYVGEVASQKAGAGINLLGLREYRDGDSLSSISWKKSASMQDLYVKEFEKDIARNALIVVDTKARNHLGCGASHTFDLAKAFSLSLCRSYLSKGANVSLLAGNVVVKEKSGPASIVIFEKSLHELKMMYLNPYGLMSAEDPNCHELEKISTLFRPPMLVYFVAPYSEEVENYILENMRRMSRQFEFKICFIDTIASAEMVRRRFNHFRELVRWPVYDKAQVNQRFAKYNIYVNWINVRTQTGHWDYEDRQEKIS